jgi:hypothetical protein
VCVLRGRQASTGWSLGFTWTFGTPTPEDHLQTTKTPIQRLFLKQQNNNHILNQHRCRMCDVEVTRQDCVSTRTFIWWLRIGICQRYWGIIKRNWKILLFTKASTMLRVRWVCNNYLLDYTEQRIKSCLWLMHTIFKKTDLD